MDNASKYEEIRKWVDPEERVTVDFLDEKDLNATVTACTVDHVDISIQTHFPHLKQMLSIPLGEVELGEDRTKYTRDPEKPLQYGRLKLIIKLNRQKWA
jgi:hypothetical protein